MKEQIITHLEKQFRKKSVAATGYKKKKTNDFINTYVPTLYEYAAAATMNALDFGDQYYSLPIDAISKENLTKAEKKTLQFAGYDCAYYVEHEGKIHGLTSKSPKYGFDVKVQNRALQHGSVTLEVFVMKGGKKVWKSWLWDNKTEKIVWCIQEKAYLLNLSDLQKYANDHIDEAITLSDEEANKDKGYSHDSKYIVKLPLDTLYSLALRDFTLLPSYLRILKSRIPTIVKHSLYSETSFHWVDAAITRAEEVHGKD